MAYTVLARRYRSATFDEVVGQNHVAQTLKKAIESGRIAHAYLFCGTRGVGKTSMARILAKALNCQKAKGPTAEPCLECESCKAIARGDDIDVIEIDAASNTQVEKTREVILDNAQFRPAHSRFKIYIIDEVHMLSKSSFNALLKTLEEPPEHVKFILATTEPEKVLATILSRCQRYDFRNIPTREIAEHLKRICKDEKIKADDEALMLVAKAGAGSMRDSLSLLDRLLSIGEKQLTVQSIEQLLGLPRAQLILDLAQAIGEGRVKDVLTQADRMIMQGLSPDALLASLIDHFRNLLILRTCGLDSQLVEVAGLSAADLKKQIEQFDVTVLSQNITILEELRRQMRQSQLGRALLDATLVRLALSDQFTSIGELLSRTGGGGSQSSAAPAAQKKKPEPAVAPAIQPPAVQAASAMADEDDDLPRPGKVWEGGPSASLSELLRTHQAAQPTVAPASPPPAPAERSNVEPIAEDDLPEVWRRLLVVLQDKSAALHSLVSQGRLAGIEDNQAVIQYSASGETFARMLSRNGKKELVCDGFSQVLGRSIGVRFEVDAAEDAKPAESSAAAEPAGALSSGNVDRPPAQASAPSPAMQSGRLSNEQRLELEKDPLIHAILTQLDATMLKLSDE